MSRPLTKSMHTQQLHKLRSQLSTGLVYAQNDTIPALHMHTATQLHFSDPVYQQHTNIILSVSSLRILIISWPHSTACSMYDTIATAASSCAKPPSSWLSIIMSRPRLKVDSTRDSSHLQLLCMSCIVYCACSAVDGCCNPFTMREDGDDDQQTEYESEEELVDNKKRLCYPLMKLTQMISCT